MRSNAKFIGIVVAVAAVAFVGTMWLSSSPELTVIQAAAPAQAASRAYDFACDVQYVTDGDTLRCTDGTRVRLHAVAARETDNSCSPGHPCPTASAATSTAALRRLAGSRIVCDRTGSSYERVTAICWNSAGVEINCAMVESGAAVVWDRFNRQRAICQT
jgi:endonuclease YncB( thermonuclease family)